MLIPPLPNAEVHCSRMAQPSDCRLISLVPTCWPCGLVTFHLPNQKPNCRNSGATHPGGWQGAGGGDSAHEVEMSARASAIGTRNFIDVSLADFCPPSKSGRFLRSRESEPGSHDE